MRTEREQEFIDLGYEAINRFEKISAVLHDRIFRFASQTIEGGDVRFTLATAADHAADLMTLLADIARRADKMRGTRAADRDDWILGHVIRAHSRSTPNIS